MPQELIKNRESLIENELHSRKNSSYCKQRTYKILIENEFHSQVQAGLPPRIERFAAAGHFQPEGAAHSQRAGVVAMGMG